jgi:hypothetical protein
MKNKLPSILEKSPGTIAELLARFHQIVDEVTDPKMLNLDITEYKFAHEEDNKIYKYLANCGDLRSSNKIVRFDSKNNSNKSNYNSNNYGLLNNYHNDYLETSVIIDSDARGPKYSIGIENTVNRSKDYKISDKYHLNQPSFSSTTGNFSRSNLVLI